MLHYVTQMTLDEQINFLVSEDTKKNIEEAAEKEALKVSTYIRHKIKTEILQEGGQEA